MKTLIALISICFTSSVFCNAAPAETEFQVEIAATIDGIDVSKLFDLTKDQASDTSGSTALPRVTTKIGQKAIVQIVREYLYPVSYSAPRVPDEFQTSNIGVTLSITPLRGPNGMIYYFGSLAVALAPDMKKSMLSKSGDISTILESTKWFSGETDSGRRLKLDFLTPDGKPATFLLLLTSMDADGKPIK